MNTLLKLSQLRPRFSRGLGKLPAVSYHPYLPSFRNVHASPKGLRASAEKRTSLPCKVTEMLYFGGLQKCLFQTRNFSIGSSKQTHYRRPISWIKWVGILSVCTALIAGFILMVKLHTTDIQLRAQGGDCCCESETSEDETRECNKTVESNNKPLPTLPEVVQAFREGLMKCLSANGVPGVAVAVSVDGELVWSEGFGYADIENKVPCTPETVMNIGALTRAITMTAVAQLWEEDSLDIDKPVQHYVPEFPEKTWMGEKMTITTRHLVSDLGGIRHNSYAADENKNQNAMHEAINQTRYSSVIESMEKFKDDPLIVKPGKYHYSTHSWDLVGAVVERAAKTPYKDYIKNLLNDLGMTNTHFSQNEEIIRNRGRQYIVHEGQLYNAPYHDRSDKLPSEGLVSNVLDLVKFGNAMLSSYTTQGDDSKSGFLSKEIMHKIWPPAHSDVNKNILRRWQKDMFPMGWFVSMMPLKEKKGFAVFQHAESASVSGYLILLPRIKESCSCKTDKREKSGEEMNQTNGVVISILANSYMKLNTEGMCTLAGIFSLVDKTH